MLLILAGCTILKPHFFLQCFWLQLHFSSWTIFMAPNWVFQHQRLWRLLSQPFFPLAHFSGSSDQHNFCRSAKNSPFFARMSVSFSPPSLLYLSLLGFIIFLHSFFIRLSLFNNLNCSLFPSVFIYLPSFLSSCVIFDYFSL